MSSITSLLAMQTWAPFRPRVEVIAAAVARANAETGRNTLHAPSMLSPLDQFEQCVLFAVEAAAGAYLVMPGRLAGIPFVCWLPVKPFRARSLIGMRASTIVVLPALNTGHWRLVAKRSVAALWAAYERMMRLVRRPCITVELQTYESELPRFACPTLRPLTVAHSDAC